jgi:hypothetical protein
MRGGALVALALATALGCVARGPSAASGTAASNRDGHGPGASAAAAVGPAAAPDPCGPPEPRAEPPACRTQQALAIDLDHDGAGECVRWTRCGPTEISWGSDGGILYPRDSVVVTRAAGTPLPLYDNSEAPELGAFEVLTPMQFGPRDTRLFAMNRVYGTGNIQMWDIYDIADGALRSAPVQETKDETSRLLRPGETVRKQYRVYVNRDGTTLTESLMVYVDTDPNCCPSAAFLWLQFTGTPRGLQLLRAWREPVPDQ